MADRKTPASDGSTATQDAPPVDQKAAPVEEDITAQGGLQAVKPDGPVEDLDANADYVQYMGKATTRRITVEDWEKARVPDQGEVVWDKSNDFQVPLSDLNDKALAALRRDSSFAIPEGK